MGVIILIRCQRSYRTYDISVSIIKLDELVTNRIFVYLVCLFQIE